MSPAEKEKFIEFFQKMVVEFVTNKVDLGNNVTCDVLFGVYTFYSVGQLGAEHRNTGRDSIVIRINGGNPKAELEFAKKHC